MQNTPNYGLITVEGTDVVNPLVQMNPNFTAIDAAMFANKQATIGTASEITSGTVHNITRNNADSNYIKFTATSDWHSGDSMTIDGTAVSVFLPDGKIPGEGSYVINSEVFGILNGTRFTIYVSPAYALNDLADVSINTASAGEVLKFDGNDWINQALTAADSSYGTGSTVKTALDDIFAQIGTIETRFVNVGPSMTNVIPFKSFAILYFGRLSDHYLYTVSSEGNIKQIASDGNFVLSASADSNNITITTSGGYDHRGVIITLA